ncbi:transposase [Alcanivorax sp. N3-2A]|nr:transposase [Alcanivorax sp. N3-2A]
MNLAGQMPGISSWWRGVGRLAFGCTQQGALGMSESLMGGALATATLPATTWQITQCSVHRQRCFLLDMDRHHYLALLRRAARRHNCAVHAYVLMDDHVRLLLSDRRPGLMASRPGAVESLMATLAGAYLAYLNQTYERRGVLWQTGFYRIAMASESALLASHRDIELSPVRAGRVVDPGEYPWSSFQGNALGLADPVLSEHAGYRRLGHCRRSRCEAYRQLVWAPLRPARQPSRDGERAAFRSRPDSPG